MVTIQLTKEELIIIQDLVSKEKWDLIRNDWKEQLKEVNDLNTKLRKELNK